MHPSSWYGGGAWSPPMDIDPEHRPDGWPHHHDMSVGEAFGRISEQLHREHEHTDHQLRRIMATQEELDAKVAEVTSTLTTQFQQVTDEVQALKDAVAAGQSISLDSFAGLDAAVQSVSDAVPDAPAPSPEPVPAPAPEPVPVPEPAPAEPPTNPTF